MSDYDWVAPVAQVGVTALGEAFAQKSKAEQQDILQRALAEFGNISPPTLERVIADQEGPSAFEGIQADPESRAAQYAALDSLKGISDAGGHTLTDTANLNRVRNQAAGIASSGRHRIQEQMDARGQGSSGATLAMQLAGNEGAANRASQEGMDIAGQAQRRALDAIMQRGKLGGEIRGQQYGEDARKAQARDLLARYNSQARQRAQYYNAGLGQQNYDNRLRRAAGMSGQYGGLANFQGGQAQDTRGFASGINQAVGALGGAYSASQDRQQPAPVSAAPLVNAPDEEDEWTKWPGSY